MDKLKKYIEKEKKEIKIYKKLSQKRVQEAHEIVKELIGILKATKLENDALLFEYNGLGFNWAGTDGVGYWLFLANDKGKVFYPSCVGGSYCIDGNPHAVVECMNEEEILETIKKLPNFVKNFLNIIKKLKEEFKKGGKDE